MNTRYLLIVTTAVISYLYIGAAEPANQEAGSVQASESAEVSDSVSVNLDELTVVAMKKPVKSDGAKLTYDVTEDPQSKSDNILEILRKVPGVTVDADDNIRVNGQSSFKVLMNGHEDNLLKGDLKTALKSIPASTIRKIEVISEPGAKYDAEGIGGILNIITDTQTRMSGFMTQLNTWFSTTQIGGSVNGKVKTGNVMTGVQAWYNNGSLFPRIYSWHNEREDLTGSPNHLMLTDSKSRNLWDNAGGNINMSWERDTLNLFTLSVDIGHVKYDTRSSASQTLYGRDYNEMDPAASMLWNVERRTSSIYNNNSVGAQASYQHSFGRRDNNLVISYLYDYGRTNSHARRYVEQSTSPDIEMPYSDDVDKGTLQTHVGQVDYSNQLGEHHLLEAGGKMNISRNGSDQAPWYGEDEATAAEDADSRVDLMQFMDIYALYASYTGSYGKFGVKAGLRYEYTNMGLRYKVGDHPDFTTHLNDLIPNMALTYNFTPASTLRLAYQMRLYRPQVSILNPYRDTTVPGTVEYGNPDLKSVKLHGISLGYSNYEGKFSGSAKLSHRYSSNSITDIIFAKDGVFHSTYANVGKQHVADMDLSGDWNITNSLRWSIYLGVAYEYNSAESELITAKKCGWQMSVNSNVNYTMPCKLRLSAYGGYWTPWIDIQSRGCQQYYYGLSLSRSFLKDDALTVQLSAQNILPVIRGNHYTQADRTMVYRSQSVYKQWNVNLGISWRIGGLKAEVKRTAADVEAEATSQGGGKRNK